MGAKSGGSKSSKKSGGKTGSGKKLPPKPKRKSPEEQLRDEIWAMTLTLSADSLKKLLQDAAILAHNERVLHDYNANKGQRGQQAGRILAAVEEGRDDSYFIIILNNYRNFLSREEMTRLVKLCHSAENARDAAERLYVWIERDRRDIRKNSEIDDPGDPSLPALWKQVIESYDLT
ncbi:MAG TPA: hypothetical protein PLM53_19740 [Spirochaetota bacterium]|nr:hypothetical protein [Spirochaetota bacterium]HQH99327.1 hypothetical protein [Spirochaetota bacterium]